MAVLQLSPFQTLLRSTKLVIETAPGQIAAFTIVSLLDGLGPTLVLFLGKVVIDQISQTLTNPTGQSPLTTVLANPLIWGSMAGVILVNFLLEANTWIVELIFANLRQKVQGQTQAKVLQQVATFADIALFENPELLNIVQLAESAITRLQELARRLGSTLIAFFGLVPAIALSMTIAWWVPLSVIVAAAPSVFVQNYAIGRSWDVEAAQAGRVRYMKMFESILTRSEYAKELRLYDLPQRFLARWTTLFQDTFKEMQQVRWQAAIANIACSFLSDIGVAIPYIYVVLGAVDQHFTLGDLALYAGLIDQLRRTSSTVITNLAELYDVALGTQPIFQLLALEPQIQTLTLATATAAPPPPLPNSPPAVGLHLDQVCFTYPGSDRPSLKDITLTIAAGQTVALVGENGAGKTTLTKLLCRLYDPDSGLILWNQQDLRSLPLENLRQQIAVVFQDYARFPMTVRENVGFGNVAQLDNDDQLWQVLTQAGVSAKVRSLPQALETPLGKQLEAGVDLSGGQWQRIAIARSLMRQPQAQLLIFDEPTAALDPKTESDIYDCFRTLAQDKTAIVVTHRLALAKMADLVVVLDQGQIIEMGSHLELMAQQGSYAEMFSRQASSYWD